MKIYTIPQNLKESQFSHMAVSGGDCNVHQGIRSSNWSEHAQLDVCSLFQPKCDKLQKVYTNPTHQTNQAKYNCFILCVQLFFFQVPLFQNTELGFQKMLAMCIKPVYYLSKEYIVRKYDFGSEVSPPACQSCKTPWKLSIICHILYFCHKK